MKTFGTSPIEQSVSSLIHDHMSTMSRMDASIARLDNFIKHNAIKLNNADISILTLTTSLTQLKKDITKEKETLDNFYKEFSNDFKPVQK